MPIPKSQYISNEKYDSIMKWLDNIDLIDESKTKLNHQKDISMNAKQDEAKLVALDKLHEAESTISHEQPNAIENKVNAIEKVEKLRNLYNFGQKLNQLQTSRDASMESQAFKFNPIEMFRNMPTMRKVGAAVGGISGALSLASGITELALKPEPTAGSSTSHNLPRNLRLETAPIK